METSDFYDTAVLALNALERSTAPWDKIRTEAIHRLRDFIRAADEETAENNAAGHEHDRKEWRDGR